MIAQLSLLIVRVSIRVERVELDAPGLDEALPGSSAVLEVLWRCLGMLARATVSDNGRNLNSIVALQSNYLT